MLTRNSSSCRFTDKKRKPNVLRKLEEHRFVSCCMIARRCMLLLENSFVFYHTSFMRDSSMFCHVYLGEKVIEIDGIDATIRVLIREYLDDNRTFKQVTLLTIPGRISTVISCRF